MPRASGSAGKDLNSRLECRSQLIPIKGHEGRVPERTEKGSSGKALCGG